MVTRSEVAEVKELLEAADAAIFKAEEQIGILGGEAELAAQQDNLSDEEKEMAEAVYSILNAASEAIDPIEMKEVTEHIDKLIEHAEDDE